MYSISVFQARSDDTEDDDDNKDNDNPCNGCDDHNEKELVATSLLFDMVERCVYIKKEHRSSDCF